MPEIVIGGRYRVIDCLRKTAFSETYLAEDTQLPGNPRCVVKKLQTQSNEQFILDTAKRLFKSEAIILYKLSDHDRIPRLLAHLELDREFYLVQEFIEGKDLSHTEIVPGRKLSKEDVIILLREVLEVLDFVHKNEVIHRDIKPSNLIRRSDGRIVLIDFGAVKEKINNATMMSSDSPLTVAVGTPGYMAPEQQMGRPRYNSDIYALGMTAIQALTGISPNDLPRDPQTDEIVWRSHAHNCPKSLVDLIDRMVRSSFRERYQKAEDVLRDLHKIKIGDTGIKPAELPIGYTPPNPIKRIALFSIPAVVALGAILIVPKIVSAVRAINFYNNGNQLLDAQKYDEAIAAFDQAIAIKPDFAQALTNRGFALGKVQKYLEKYSACTRATEADPTFPEAWNCRGLARYELKQYQASITEYDRAIEADPKFYRAWFNKGQAYLALGKYEESLEATRKVLGIEPNYYLAWTQSCQALYQLGSYQEAKANCEESLKIQPNYEPTKNLLSRVQQKLDGN